MESPSRGLPNPTYMHDELDQLSAKTEDEFLVYLFCRIYSRFNPSKDQQTYIQRVRFKEYSLLKRSCFVVVLG